MRKDLISVDLTSELECTYQYKSTLQRSAKVFVHGCKKFVIALACLFCLALPESCLARFAYFLADLCTLCYSSMDPLPSQSAPSPSCFRCSFLPSLRSNSRFLRLRLFPHLRQTAAQRHRRQRGGRGGGGALHAQVPRQAHVHEVKKKN